MSEQTNGAFPTGIYRAGNEIAIRLCSQNGERKIFRHRFQPEIFIPAPYGLSEDAADGFALRGEPDIRKKTPLTKMKFDSMYDFGNYISENMDIPGVRMYGSPDPTIQAFSAFFPHEYEPNFKHIRTFNLDIEVLSSYKMQDGSVAKGPFPEPIIEEEKYRTKKFDSEEYSAYITKFYQWWNVEFAGSTIPIWTNLNSAFPIVSLQLSDKNINKRIIWGLPLKADRGKFKYDNGDKEIGGLDLEYREFTTEQDMLIDFVRYWASRQPDAWTGWNTHKFDSPYLAERILKILGEDWLKSLSPIGRYRKHLHKPKKGIPFHTYDFTGVPNLPYDELYKKHRLKERARYSLNFICHVELKEKKLDYSEASSLNNLYFTDYAKYIRYGVKDIVLVDKLDDKLGFLNLTYMLGALYHCNYSDTLATVQPWTALLYNFNKLRGRYPKLKRVNDSSETYDGAFVHSPVPGRYKNLLSEDLNSLYPHILQQYNMGPETIVEGEERRDIIWGLIQELENYKCADFNRNRARLALLEALRNEKEIINELVEFGPFDFLTLKKHGVSMAPNLQFFINSEMSCYNLIMREKYTKRKGFKKQMLGFETQIEEFKKSNLADSIECAIAKLGESNSNTSQMGVKILMNAGYGAIGNSWLKEYYDPRIARAITAAGELINKWVTKYSNSLLRELSGLPNERFVVYGDTDSIYITLEKFDSSLGWDKLDRNDKIDAMDKFEKETLKPSIEKWCVEMAATVNAHEQRMFWGREVISIEGGIFKAKKMYTMLVDDSEGVRYNESKLKVTGLESKKSSTPEICVPWLEKCYELAIMNKEAELHQFVKDCKVTWMSQNPAEIGLSSSCSNVVKYMDRGKWLPIKGTPYQASASILHNKFVTDKDLSIPLITDGDKIIIANLKENNPYGNGYIAFKDFWPDEFEEVRFWLDYEGLFNKNFIEPLKLLLEAVGMDVKKKVNVLNFVKKKV